MDDRLDVLVGKYCPVCGSISQKSAARCPECARFIQACTLRKEAPPPEERPSNRDIDHTILHES